MSNLQNVIGALKQHFAVGRGGPFGATATAAPPPMPTPSAQPAMTPVLSQAMGKMASGMSPTGLKQGV